MLSTSTLYISGLVLSLLLLPRLLVELRRRSFRRAEGCQSAPCIGKRGDFLGIAYLLQWFQRVQTNSLNISLAQQFEVLGSTFEVAAGSKSRFYTINPHNLAVVWNRGARSWGLGPVRAFALEPFVGKGIMSSDGDFWEHSRSLVRPIFARHQIEDTHLALLERHLLKLFALIPGDGSTVDMQPLFGRLGLDSSTEFLFGESINTLDADGAQLDAKAFLESYNYGQRGVGTRLQLPPYNIFTRDPKFWLSCKTAHDFVDRYVDKAMNRSAASEANKTSHNAQQPYILAYELAAQTTNRRDIRNQLLNVFLPAHDAIAVVLTNLVFVLARHPDVWTKLRQELDEHSLLHAHGRMPTLDKLNQLTYLQQVLKETLRLHPTIGIISRSALVDTTLPAGGGHDGNSPVFVPKGSQVAVHVYALHRRTDVYGADAASFRPERWAGLNPTHYEFMPFGRGPRICPAEKFAISQLGYTLVRFLQKYKAVENRDSVQEFVELYKISTESKNGAKVAFVT